MRNAPTRSRLMPWLLGIALFLRALVPTGWMTAAAADGGIALIPCTGLMPASAPAAMPMHGGHHAAVPDSRDHGDGQQQDHDGKAQQLCAFSGLALAGTSAEAPPLPAPVATEPALVARGHLRITGRGLAAPPPPARGPPSA